MGGREYFGQWFDKYDPKIHDAIMGPVEEFLTGDTSLGYQEAPVGGTFVRIGVGVLRKPEDRAYERFRTYDIVDPGRWTVRPAKDRIEFVHELKSDLGYAYRYTKTIRLVGGKPEMLIEHVLRNTGRKAIATHQYNHNFFVMGEPTGPDTSVTFPFALKPKQPLSSNFAEVRDGKLVYTAELPKGPSVFSEFEGFGPSAADYDFRVENRKARSRCPNPGRQADPQDDFLVHSTHGLPGGVYQPRDSSRQAGDVDLSLYLLRSTPNALIALPGSRSGTSHEECRCETCSPWLWLEWLSPDRGGCRRRARRVWKNATANPRRRRDRPLHGAAQRASPSRRGALHEGQRRVDARPVS